MKRTWIAVAVMILALLAAWPAQAQDTVPVVNPVAVEFVPSLDHSVMGLDSNPLVASYSLRIYLEGQNQPVAVVSLGKPVPGANGKILVIDRTLFTPEGVAPNTRYVIRVVAVGPTGETASDTSNPFGNAGPPKAPAVPVVRK